jgi:non-homologous end joining protein Ku
MITATAESPSRAHTSFVLSWGMFAIPVGVYTGTEKTAVVRKEYAEGNVARPVGRIAYDKTAVAADGTIKALDTTEVVRMAEASNGAWVELTDDEIADCTSPKGLGEIVTFVPVKDTGVYLAADLYQVRPKREKGKASPAAEKAFGLLLAAMAKRKVQALVKVALRGPARYALLDAEGNLTFVHTCDAVRRPIPLETPKVTPAEVNLAVALIDAVGIDTPVITDDTAAAVRTYVDAKAKGIPAPAKPAAPAIRDDIMATLEASIAASKKKVA